MVLPILITAVVAYFLGNFNGAVIVSKLIANEDVRTKGSGNAGATNMARVYGMKAGLATFALDALKTVAAMLAGLHLGGAVGEALAGYEVSVERVTLDEGGLEIA